jgi:N-acetyl-anhydromuramyl-L-alanine amidase AmpD
MIKHGSKPVDTIFIHCSATKLDWLGGMPLSQKVAEIRRWHKNKGWTDVGYHYLIDRDGTVAQARAEHVVGSHVAGHNQGSIGICLIGGHGSNENDPFEKNYTAAQDKALRDLIENISARTQIKYVRGHNELAAKSCPGFNAKRWFAKKPAKPTLAESTTMQASAVQLLSGAGAGATAIGALDGHVQLMVVAFVAISLLATAWIMRERIRKWVRETSE